MAERYCNQFRTAKSTKKQCTSKLSSCFSSKIQFILWFKIPERRVPAIKKWFGALERGVPAMKKGFDALERRVPAIKKWFDALERRVPAIKKGLVPWNVAFRR